MECFKRTNHFVFVTSRRRREELQPASHNEQPAMLASGTSSAAVPFAVYNMPLFVAANLAPNVSPLAGNRL